jgi:hypothetical protein
MFGASKVVAPHLSRLRIVSLSPMSKFDYVLAHVDLSGPINLVSWIVFETDATPPYL